MNGSRARGALFYRQARRAAIAGFIIAKNPLDIGGNVRCCNHARLDRAVIDKAGEPADKQGDCVTCI